MNNEREDKFLITYLLLLLLVFVRKKKVFIETQYFFTRYYIKQILYAMYFCSTLLVKQFYVIPANHSYFYIII